MHGACVACPTCVETAQAAAAATERAAKEAEGGASIDAQLAAQRPDAQALVLQAAGRSAATAATTRRRAEMAATAAREAAASPRRATLTAGASRRGRSGGCAPPSSWCARGASAVQVGAAGALPVLCQCSAARRHGSHVPSANVSHVPPRTATYRRAPQQHDVAQLPGQRRQGVCVAARACTVQHASTPHAQGCCDQRGGWSGRDGPRVRPTLVPERVGKRPNTQLPSAAWALGQAFEQLHMVRTTRSYFTIGSVGGEGKEQVSTPK
jgi:hypothetical protein